MDVALRHRIRFPNGSGWIANGLRRVADGSGAPDQAKVVSAQSAPVGLEQPSKGSLKTVLQPYNSEIDGFAVRAATGEEPEDSAHHDSCTSALAALEGIV